MKIQLASDLHLEFLARWFPDERLVVPAPEADIYFKTVAKSIDQEVKDIMDSLMTHYLKPKT